VHRKTCKSGTKNLNMTFIESMTFLKKYVQFSVDIPYSYSIYTRYFIHSIMEA